MLSIISEPSGLENLILWYTGTERNGMRVLEAKVDSVAPEAVGLFV